MSYRCEVCNAQSQPGQPKLRHAVQRQAKHGMEIEQEWAVCRFCDRALRAGATIASLRAATEEVAEPVVLVDEPEEIIEPTPPRRGAFKEQARCQ